MKILGFNYTKISAERLEKLEKTEKVSQKLNFTNVDKEDSQLMKDSSILRVTFSYELIYEPNNVKILLEGFIFVHSDVETVKKAIQSWKKKKEVPEEIHFAILRTTLNKCGLKALNLEEELGIPPHMKLVKVNEQ